MASSDAESGGSIGSTSQTQNDDLVKFPLWKYVERLEKTHHGGGNHKWKCKICITWNGIDEDNKSSGSGTSNMNLRQLIGRPVFHRKSISWCSISTSTSTSNFLPMLLTAKLDPAVLEDEIIKKVINILKKDNPIESSLELLAQNLSPRIVSWVVQNPPNPQLGFRFFIWATRWRQFRTWELQELIFSMLVQDGGFNLYWKTLEELRDGKIFIPSDAFRVLISGYWTIGDAEKAVEVFGKMREFDCHPNVFAYNAILHIMVQKDVILLALAVYNLMLKSNCSPNIATYSILIDGLCKSGKSQDALNLFDEMIKKSISPNNITYSILLSGLCQANRADDARLLFYKMADSGCQPDEVTYNSLLNGLCKLGRMDEAFMLLRSLRNQGYDLGIQGYSCVIDGFFRAGRFEEANKWFSKFSEESRTPDLVLYSIMIRGFSEVGRVNDALHFMREMSNNGLVPDTQCYNALIKGFCNLGLLDDARSLKLEISENDCFPNASTYTILICAMCEHGLVEDATQIFEDMEKLGCSPSVVTFNSLIHGLCKAGELEEARLLFYKMEIGKTPSLFLRLSQGADRVLDSASLQKLVERLCESGFFLKAYRLLTKLADNGVVPNITTYNILINDMCKRKNIQGAFKLLKELQLKGLSPDCVTYGTLIDGLCRVNREEDAISMLDQITDSGVLSSSSPYKSLMTWLSRKGKVSASFAHWLKYLRSLKKWDDGLVRLLEDRLERGDLVEAIGTMLEMDLKMKEFDLGPYTIWLIGLCQAGKVEEALEVFRVLVDYKINVTPPSCVVLIQSLCREGKLDLAVDVFFYTLEKGLILKRRVCNLLVTFLLHSPSARKHAFDLLSRMESSGYDVNAYLYDTTRSHLKNYLSSMDPLMVKQDTQG